MSDEVPTIDEVSAPQSSAISSTLQELLRAGMLEPPPRPGVAGKLDRFEILGLLGEGGMGVVVLATDTATSDRVAIKLLRPELLDEPQAVRRFLREAGH